MLFGFEKNREIIPEIYRSLDQQELVMNFLIQYNSCVKDEMKIPLIYGKQAKNIREVFNNFIKDVFKVKFGKIKTVFRYNGFQARRLIFQTKKIKKYDLDQIFNIYHNGIYFNTQSLFSDYVYDKISRQNSDKMIDQQRDFIIIDKKIAIWALCKKIDIHNLEIEDEVQKISTFIEKNKFEKLYIVCPRNKNFKHFVEIKHFLCDLNKTMLKLVPYKISNQLIRRNKCQ
ncbi:hypothetical protein [Campylobacter molothri]|uniref:hypothetical protein n=1 Tax=Campylobacter molothri TaxID=1032242 RepID=UPI00301E5285|nr:hypothetical protein [Campylobacter sp. RM17709]